ncbi:carbon-nitrogen hydrolase family protein [Anaerocolumna sp. AGMB13020]|uniref:carbon-nitrogen hydrolase family protein n=1 Tax=Anaerocolumna sp. AGMB13020 TaxID=3081750 RepID=UPI00295378A4|nr:carbon-nitrogen hydrolase family protein [Anaerocolumna sp. AGMB13020]WOO36032.1 carbon-nitrogen hydrolase family protein [Anaerocolumna sp. AGMB13020]
MKNFKVAIIQHNVLHGDKEENTRLAIQYIQEANENGADFVLFPECWLTSYSAPDICSKLRPVEEMEKDTDFLNWCEAALEDDSEYIKRICDIARKLKIGVEITGFTKGKKYPQNSAFIIDRDGTVILKYSKVHTCDFDWEQYLEGGEAFHVCQFDGICIGVMICYDREHPESARELMLQGAELILMPNDCDGMKPRLQELAVEAMQNMVGIAMANPPGEYAGNSCAFHPMVWDKNGRIIDNTMVVAEALYDGIVYANFDIEAIREYREREDLGKYRKPKAYKHLV